MRIILRAGRVLLVSFACIVCLCSMSVATAQSLPAGAPPMPQGGPASGASVKPGEIGAGSTQALNTINSLFTTVVTTAITASATVKPQADKFAFGLAVITLVLGFVRFSASHHPVSAWVALFEELATLGIFASFYLGYAGWAPGFFKWFISLAQSISGADMTHTASIISSAAGQLFDGFILAFKDSSFWTFPAILISVIPLLAAWLILSLTAIVFTYFTLVGQLQMAVGFVMGQIAVALGFSSFTRGWFKSWLDYMISAGMYVVVAAALVKLVAGSMITAIQTGAGIGLSTPYAAVDVMDLSIMVFLLSFEIPKMAAMFGGGASASGAMLGKIGKAAAGTAGSVLTAMKP